MPLKIGLMRGEDTVYLLFFKSNVIFTNMAIELRSSILCTANYPLPRGAFDFIGYFQVL